MTGSAITIVMSQWPKLFGIPDVRLQEPPYIVLAEVLVRLPLTSLDVAFGLAALVFLYGIKYACGRISCRSPKLQKAVFLFGIMRNGIIVIVGTLICFLINISTGDSPVSIIRSVPAGFDSMGIPNFDFNIIRQSGSLVPSIVLILVLEHISVAKSFGRINDYSINPDQEIMAIGISNIVGSFFG
jgi:sodium-independent sulfate anion transporter 11